MMEAKIEAGTTVPLEPVTFPPSISTMSAPCAETSGIPLPVVLKRPLLVEPMELMYEETWEDWYEGALNKLEKPPPEKLAPVSGIPAVAPTEVTKGQVEGKVGMKLPFEVAWGLLQTPKPVGKMMDVPCAPSCM
jgi:hypothetical protein